jgi:hypothetical protein
MQHHLSLTRFTMRIQHSRARLTKRAITVDCNDSVGVRKFIRVSEPSPRVLWRVGSRQTTRGGLRHRQLMVDVHRHESEIALFIREWISTYWAEFDEGRPESASGNGS